MYRNGNKASRFCKVLWSSSVSKAVTFGLYSQLHCLASGVPLEKIINFLACCLIYKNDQN